MLQLFILIGALFISGNSFNLERSHHRKKKNIINVDSIPETLKYSSVGHSCQDKMVSLFEEVNLCLYQEKNLCDMLTRKTYQVLEEKSATDSQIMSDLHRCARSSLLQHIINNYDDPKVIAIEELYCKKDSMTLGAKDASIIPFEKKDACLCQYMFGDAFTPASQTTCTNANHIKKGNVCFDENHSHTTNDLSQCTLAANDCEICIHNVNNNWCTADPDCEQSCGQNSKLYTFWKTLHKDDQNDCMNVCDDIPTNSAFLDDCGTCSEGTSGHTANSEKDCAGVCPNGNNAFLDDCGTCSEGTSGHTANSEKDCTGLCFGAALLDDCGTCSGGTSGHTANSEKDCAGLCFGAALLDDCNTCAGGTSNHTANSDQDCAGVCDGSAFLDDCTVCSGGTSGHVANSDQDCAGVCDGSSTEDCAGVCDGSSVQDNCGTCDTNAQNDCVQDCAGVWGGTATTDLCGTCDDDAQNDCVHIPSIAEVISDIDEFTGSVSISQNFYIAYDLTRSYDTANNLLLTTSQTAAANGYSPEQYINTTLQSLANIYGTASYQAAFQNSDLTSADIVAQTDLSAYKSPYIDGATHYTLETTESTWALKYSNGHSILSGTRTNTTLVGLPSPENAMIEFPVSLAGAYGYQVVDDSGQGVLQFDLSH